jgi:hypothetical protein
VIVPGCRFPGASRSKNGVIRAFIALSEPVPYRTAARGGRRDTLTRTPNRRRRREKSTAARLSAALCTHTMTASMPARSGYDPCTLCGWHRFFADISTGGAGGSATFVRRPPSLLRGQGLLCTSSL